jgi:hypothetical protein
VTFIKFDLDKLGVRSRLWGFGAHNAACRSRPTLEGGQLAVLCRLSLSLSLSLTLSLAP